MGVFYLGFNFLFGHLVLVTRSSGSQYGLWSSKQSLQVGGWTVVDNMAFDQAVCLCLSWGLLSFCLVWSATVLLTGKACTCSQQQISTQVWCLVGYTNLYEIWQMPCLRNISPISMLIIWIFRVLWHPSSLVCYFHSIFPCTSLCHLIIVLYIQDLIFYVLFVLYLCHFPLCFLSTLLSF